MAEIKFTTNGSGSSENNTAKAKKGGIIVLVVVILILILAAIFNCFTIVNEGFIGVKYRFGKIEEDDLTAGLNFRIPFIEEIEQVDTREQAYSITTDAYTSDTQTVNELQLKLNYCYDSSQLSNIIRNIGVHNVESKLLAPNVSKITKDAIGKVKAEALVQSRAAVTEEIQNSLTAILSQHGIVVTAFAIENLSFDDAFEASIQAKVIAAQDALRMENKTKEKEEEAKQVVIAAQAEADAKLIAAEAEAKAIELIQAQISASPTYIDYLKIESWNGVLPQVMGNDVNPFVALDGTQGATTYNRETTPTPVQ